MTEPLFPGSDLVGVGWLKLLAGLPADKIATKLPKDDAALRAPGFVRTMIVGGSPSASDLAWRAPVITAECWTAPAPGSQKVPWGTANQLAEQIVMATYDRALMGRRIDLSAINPLFVPVRVASVLALTEPRRVDDPSGFARFDVDLKLNWRIDG